MEGKQQKMERRHKGTEWTNLECNEPSMKVKEKTIIMGDVIHSELEKMWVKIRSQLSSRQSVGL